jgi:hypothetical protein
MSGNFRRLSHQYEIPRGTSCPKIIRKGILELGSIYIYFFNEIKLS